MLTAIWPWTSRRLISFYNAVTQLEGASAAGVGIRRHNSVHQRVAAKNISTRVLLEELASRFPDQSRRKAARTNRYSATRFVAELARAARKTVRRCWQNMSGILQQHDNAKPKTATLLGSAMQSRNEGHASSKGAAASKVMMAITRSALAGAAMGRSHESWRRDLLQLKLEHRRHWSQVCPTYLQHCCRVRVRPSH